MDWFDKRIKGRKGADNEAPEESLVGRDERIRELKTA